LDIESSLSCFATAKASAFVGAEASQLSGRFGVSIWCIEFVHEVYSNCNIS